ncbi:transcription termination/antitermination protein NusA [Candidatus Campbellbacteria bacterium CG11_big_fil_rev_8_21_14_0_20_44_21]|uniref:Transcription termination/antitermination protein NusA n=1 Tax=Candidatus Campbellbacteria bacterium CG22_combo_CG10-13_8_21_14_all_43_18 TaxID=1974530 RepID=A0A2H0DWA4_9BACT|nr:MAG: transcription termination/antitermination protein NusA [Candidatus Campbellbacteria bacterium CG22_combo_CG10-13_8_21_14_all_43_18]PIR24279.1 MAG: transcription termination/antitermination protein NusA [Candidatus Campbellbacteria bacterium CG11_big_fil_rev_8_21_14_0_20_44_21]
MFDLKIINSVLTQLEEERGIPKEKVLEAIEAALASAYKKEYGKKGQIIKAEFDPSSGKTEFFQVKIVVDKTSVRFDENDTEPEKETPEEELLPKYDPEKHLLIEDAKKIKKSAEIDEEMIFPLEHKTDYGRISAQTAKQVIIQKIREAEKVSILKEFGEREGSVVGGTVQRIERGNIFVDLGRATGILPREEQIPGERYRQGERIRALLYSVEESPRGTYLRMSRSNPEMIRELFKLESPEVQNKTVEIKSIAREPGSRSKIAVFSHEDSIDPVGSLVGQRGVRVSTVMSELGGEKIDIIEWSEDPARFVAGALSPASVLSVETTESHEEKRAKAEVTEDQLSLAIGKGGQNVRLAAKLTGWKIDIASAASTDAVDAAEDEAAKEEKIEAENPSDENENKEKEKTAEEEEYKKKKNAPEEGSPSEEATDGKEKDGENETIETKPK